MWVRTNGGVVLQWDMRGRNFLPKEEDLDRRATDIHCGAMRCRGGGGEQLWDSIHWGD